MTAAIVTVAVAAALINLGFAVKAYLQACRAERAAERSLEATTELVAYLRARRPH